MGTIEHNLQAVSARVASACRAAGRPVESVQLLAVSKTMPSEAVRAAFSAGQRAFGENYVQEGVEKVTSLRSLASGASHKGGQPSIQWHFIGPLQSNKTRVVAEHFDWVHSVDRLKIAERLSEQRAAYASAQTSRVEPLNLCLQVNISAEASKSGVSPAELAALAHAVAALPHVRLRGLMCIPEPAADFERQRAPFAQLRQLLEQLRDQGLALDTLSMGMTADIEAAVAEGATIVRVGTAIFGERSKPQ